jgi:glycosyltransferase involved in cell wall biosynthesis
MTFGGAETLIYNYCREIKDDFNITFVTGLQSNHEWEYKFKEITPYIYHLPNLFEDESLYIEFISNYVQTRNIDILHIIHNGFTFKMLPELRKRHTKLKIVVTMFNDRVEYFEQSIEVQEYIDAFTTDNQAVAKHYAKELGAGKSITVIPNGINCYEEFNPILFDRVAERKALGLKDEDLAIFFVGRLSVEKNPDVFIGAAEQILVTQNTKNVKFFVVGDGPMRPNVERLLKDIDNDAITYLGYQSEVAKFLSAADVFVLPSSIEGFPLSILEAMAMRVVVVASDVGAIPDVIKSGDDGFVVTPGSAPEIAEALSKLKANPKLLESMKDKSREKVEKNYSNRQLGKNYKQAYRKLAP